MCRKLFVFSLVSLLFAIVSSAQASVLYYDDFDGPAGVDLTGTTPDISYDGANWLAGEWINADGTYGGGSSGQMFTAVLPLSPIIGAAYELSATVDNQGDWVGIAFLSSSGTVTTRLNDNSPQLWALTRPSDSTAKDQAFVGPGTAGGLGNATTSSVEELKVRVEMNSATDWLVTWYFDGSPEFQQTVDPVASGIEINYVAFGGNGLFGACTGTISSFKLLEIPQAMKPNPANNSLAYSTTVPLQWQPGVYAAEHDVYFGENFDDVNDANTETEGIYKGRQDPNSYTVTDLTAGLTYYWRIDGVDPDGVTIDKGEVWSFSVQPLTAYNPSPSDGAKYLDPNIDLTWSAGANAMLHNIYFGTTETLAFKRTQTATTYDPGALEYGTTYYWRIDERSVDGTVTGDVWQFTTMPLIPITYPNLVGWWKLDEGQGDKALDWSGQGNHGTLVNGPRWVTAGHIDGGLEFDGVDDQLSLPIGSVISSLTDSTFAIWVNAITSIGNAMPRIFDFGNGTDTYMYLSPGRGGEGGSSLQFNITTQGSVAVQLIAPFTLATGWHHLAVVIDSVNRNIRLYLDGDVVVSELTQTLPKDLDNTTQNWLGISQAGDNALIGFLDDFRIYNQALTQNEIERVMTGDPLLASKPRPADGATADIEHATPLNWLPGENAAQHDVYFGTDEDAVENADISDTTGIYRGRGDPNTYTPSETLEPRKTYYWRIDEVNTDATISEGKVWSFTISDYLIVDDFEEYGDVDNRIFDVWTDFFVNNTGMTVGYFDPPFAEQSIVHGGFQSMYMRYDNDGTVNEGTDYEQSGTLLYSETQREWPNPQDWTRKGVTTLMLWFRGAPAAVGSFTTGPPITMTAAGEDIWGSSDQFHYAYKQLAGVGSITAKVVSVSNTDPSAKAGVMIRESLEPGSAHGMVVVTPSNGVTFQYRDAKGEDSQEVAVQAGITAPQWVRLTRSGNTLTAEYSANGSNWETLGTVALPMLTNVYVGLCLTAHNANETCVAEFSDVTTSGTITGDWRSQDIGIESNVPEQLYVVLADSAGNSAMIIHPDSAATTIGSWTQWDILLADFTGMNMQAIKSMTIGVGSKDNTQPGGAGVLYIDDIGLSLPVPTE